MEKWARIQAKCAIASLILGALGLPPSYYCAYSVLTSGSPAGSHMMTPVHFDIAFVLMICFYALAAVGGIVWFIVGRKHRLAVENSPGTEALEAAIEKVLVRKGIQPNTQSVTTAIELVEKPQEQTPTPLVIDGEIFRIVSAPKGPFASETKQVMELMKTEFIVDVDILVEMYVVNVSAEAQYIRDFQASIEIDGRRIELIRQADFDAWDLQDDMYEYCLDPEPEENKLLRPARLQALTPLFPSIPVELGPRKPFEGWVHFLLRDISPEKIEENRSYIFTLVDSLGTEYLITRSRHRDLSTRTKITARKKGGIRR
jgi:hypothetical protein